jgi:hypothetical protein
MKKINILYWTTTGLFSLFMISTAIPNIMKDTASVDLIVNTLGFPAYFLEFIGIAKTLGAVAILVPGFPRIKEWAYAGLCFDLVGATYSVLAVSGPDIGMLFMVLPFGFLFLSYFYHHKRLKAQSTADVSLAAA